jgi:hypothetical protein
LSGEREARLFGTSLVEAGGEREEKKRLTGGGERLKCGGERDR